LKPPERLTIEECFVSIDPLPLPATTTFGSIVLVTIYSKSDISDIAAETVQEIIAQYEQQFTESEEL
jgi:hypothetical protein